MYISHSGFMYTHVGTLTHCTKLKTSLVGHGLKDEGLKTKTFHIVAFVLDAEEHVLSSSGDGRGETNITACLRNCIVRILTTGSISVHFCLGIFILC